MLVQHYTEDQVDEKVASILQTYTCRSCGHVFKLTVAKATDIRRSHGDMICPKCGVGGASKDIDTRPEAFSRPLSTQPVIPVPIEPPPPVLTDDFGKPTPPSPERAREKK